MEAIRQCGDWIEDVSEELKSDRDLIMIAIKYSPFNIYRTYPNIPKDIELTYWSLYSATKKNLVSTFIHFFKIEPEIIQKVLDFSETIELKPREREREYVCLSEILKYFEKVTPVPKYLLENLRKKIQTKNPNQENKVLFQ